VSARRARDAPHACVAAPARLVDCGPSRAGEILAILNDAIATSTALWDYRPRSAASMRRWFAAKAARGDPVIGALADDGTLAGFATYGPCRDWPAYKYTVVHSLYVHPRHRGRGVGRTLLAAIVERARRRDLHNLVAGIEAGNDASRAFHLAFGFERCGTVRHAGFKFQRWLDLDLFQLLLDTPSAPLDG